MMTPSLTSTQNFLGEDKWGEQLYQIFYSAFSKAG
jgi:hypothetical protein